MVIGVTLISRTLFIGTLLLLLTGLTFAQPKAGAGVDDQFAIELSKAALAAHGGDKLKAMRSMVLKGAVDMNVMGQTMPGAFSIAFKGEKYFFDLQTPAQSLKQVYNGESTYTSVQGFYLPPAASIGFPVLAHVGDAGYVVSAPGDAKKKGKGFRVTTPDGYYTDFFVDEKTKQIKSYNSSYDLGGGRIVTTSVEMEAFETVDGILAPKKYSQRFDMGSLTGYGSFNAKIILINKPIEDSAFAMPSR